jgi:hypothetical protein
MSASKAVIARHCVGPNVGEKSGRSGNAWEPTVDIAPAERGSPPRDRQLNLQKRSAWCMIPAKQLARRKEG